MGLIRSAWKQGILIGLFAIASIAQGQVPDIQPTAKIVDAIEEALRLPITDRILKLKEVLGLAEQLKDKAGEAKVDIDIGFFASEIDQNDEAIDYYNRGLAIEREIGNRSSEAQALNGLGAIYDSLGKKSDAIDSFEKALEIRKSIKDLKGQATTFDNLGHVYDSLGDGKRAIDYFKLALPIDTQLGNKKGCSIVLNNLGLAYKNTGDKQKALDCFSQSLTLCLELMDKRGEAFALSNIGYLYQSLGNLQNAIEFDNRALTAEREVGDRRAEAQTLNNLGNISILLDENDRASELLAQAYDVESSLGDQFTAAKTMSAQANVSYKLGNSEAALKTLSQAIRIQRSEGDKPGLEVSLCDLGAIDNDLGFKQDAIGALTESLELCHQIGDKDQEGAIERNLGSVYQSLGRNDLAIDHFNRASELYSRSKNPIGASSVIGDIGYLRASLGHFKEALALYQSCLDARRALGDRIGEAHMLSNIGKLYSSTKNWGKSADFFNQSLAIERDLGDRSGEAYTLSNIGLGLDGRGDTTKALASYNQALGIFRELGDRMGEASTLRNIGADLNELKQPDIALLMEKMAVNVYQSLRRDIKYLPVPEKESFKKNSESVYRSLADLLIDQGKLGEAQAVLDLLKDDEYFGYVRSGREEKLDLSKEEENILAKYEEIGKNLSEASASYEALRKQSLAKLSAAEKEARNKKLGELEDLLRKARVNFQAFLEQSKTVFNAAGHETRFSDISTHLKLAKLIDRQSEPTAGIYTLVTRKGISFIFTLPHVTQLRSYHASAISYQDLRKKVGLFRQALMDPRLDPIPVASDLYDLLIRPIEPDLIASKTKKIIWSFDGPLRYIPIAALYDRVEHKYLVEKYATMSFVPAALEGLPGKGSGAVGFGATKAVKVEGIDFIALPSVSKELSAFQESTGAKLFLDQEFTEKSLREALRDDPSLVHLATHFELRPGQAGNSFLVLGDGQPLPISNLESWVENSFDVDLLVLSACNTATPDSEDTDGSEYESFARQAIANGASNVVASLWPISDAGASAIMGRFYRLRKESPSLRPMEALRQSQLWLMKGEAFEEVRLRADSGTGPTPSEGLTPFVRDPKHPLAHPFYWAPFVLTGHP